MKTVVGIKKGRDFKEIDFDDWNYTTDNNSVTIDNVKIKKEDNNYILANTNVVISKNGPHSRVTITNTINYDDDPSELSKGYKAFENKDLEQTRKEVEDWLKSWDCHQDTFERDFKSV